VLFDEREGLPFHSESLRAEERGLCQRATFVRLFGGCSARGAEARHASLRRALVSYYYPHGNLPVSVSPFSSLLLQVRFSLLSTERVLSSLGVGTDSECLTSLIFGTAARPAESRRGRVTRGLTSLVRTPLPSYFAAR